MRILYDHQIFTFQNYGGISRYYTEMIKQFHKDENITAKLNLLLSNNQYITDEKFGHRSLFPGKKSIILKIIMKVINDANSVRQLLLGKYDLFHPTYYDPYFLSFLRGKPFVLTVYDMTHERFPENVSKIDKTIEWKRKLADKADHIIAISESTKKDIIELLNIPAEKISVTYLASDISFSSESSAKLDLPEEYLLFLGNRGGYKNFEMFIKSIAQILRNRKIKLLCAGGGQFNEIEQSLINELEISDYIQNIQFTSNEELSFIYNRAKLFVFPSLYEGFGIPVLEAFQCDCPVALSNTSSLPEVGGDAVEYFDPTESSSIVNCVNKLLDNENLLEDMKVKGREQAQKFSWEICAQQTAQIYKEVIDNV